MDIIISLIQLFIFVTTWAWVINLLFTFRYMIAKTLLDANEEAAIINIPVNMTSVPFHKLNQPPWIVW